MTETTAATFLKIVSGRRGHFRLESGHHSALWLDLDALFADQKAIRPFVASLVSSLKSHAVSVVCGPLVGGAFLAQLVARELDAEFCFTECVMPRETGGMYQARYRLPNAFEHRVRGQRVAIVDDVMSAGSALRGTYTDLGTHGAIIVVAGALLVLGSVGADWFVERQIPVVAAARDDYELWAPGDCPLCTKGLRLEDVAASPTS